MTDYLGMAAIAQRNHMILLQRQQASSLAGQLAELRAQERQRQLTEERRLEIEQEKLSLERLRLRAEAEEQNLRAEQIAQIKGIRVFIADLSIGFEKLKNRYP